uniref:Uncharacterized protein n=1 Tax=Macrostomum lignano TaxID=282301 RepID=A0A1I8JQS0_9PLAT
MALNDAGIRNDAESDGRRKIASRPAFTEVQLEETFQNKWSQKNLEGARTEPHGRAQGGKEIKDKRASPWGIAAKGVRVLKVLLNYDIKRLARVPCLCSSARPSVLAIEQVYPNGAGLCAAPNSTTMDINFTTLAGDALTTVAGFTTATTAYGESNTTAFD